MADYKKKNNKNNFLHFLHIPIEGQKHQDYKNMLQFVVSISLNNQQLCNYFKMRHRVYWSTFSHYNGRLLNTRYQELPRWANITPPRLLGHKTGQYSQKFPPLYALPTSPTMPHVTCTLSREQNHK